MECIYPEDVIPPLPDDTTSSLQVLSTSPPSPPFKQKNKVRHLWYRFKIRTGLKHAEKGNFHLAEYLFCTAIAILDIREPAPARLYYDRFPTEEVKLDFPSLDWATVKSVKNRLECMNRSLGFEPSFAVFQGPPGCGKTTMIKRVIEEFKTKASVLTAEKIMVDSFMDDLVMQSEVHEQENGYGSHIFFLDELFLEYENATSHCKFIISNCTSASAMPICADINKKGKRVRPFLWMASSNNLEKFQCKVDREAVMRRISHVFKCDYGGVIRYKNVKVTEHQVISILIEDIIRRLDYCEKHFGEFIDKAIHETTDDGISLTSNQESTIDLQPVIQSDHSAMTNLHTIQKRGINALDRIDRRTKFILHITGINHGNEKKLEGLKVFRYSPTCAFVSNWEGFGSIDPFSGKAGNLVFGC